MVGTMGALPSLCAVAIGALEAMTERACLKGERVAMVTADSSPFVFAERIAALVENIDTSTPVSAPVMMTRLAEVME